MKKDVSVFLHHILESVDYIEEFTAEFSKEEFDHSTKTENNS